MLEVIFSFSISLVENKSTLRDFQFENIEEPNLENDWLKYYIKNDVENKCVWNR